MVGVGIGVDFSWNSGDDVVLWEHTGELEMGGKTRRREGTLTIEVV